MVYALILLGLLLGGCVTTPPEYQPINIPFCKVPAEGSGGWIPQTPCYRPPDTGGRYGTILIQDHHGWIIHIYTEPTPP